VRALVWIAAFVMLSGFDLFKRRDPNLEEGNKLLQDGKAEDALKAYDRALTTMPEEPVVHFDRGAALHALGKFPEAQKEFQRATEGHDPQLKADAYYNMGNALFQQQKYKEALEAYKRTLGLRADDRRAKWNMELALRRMKEQPPPPPQQSQNDKDKKDKDKKDQQQQQQQQQQAQQKKEEEKKKQQQQQQQQQQQEEEKKLAKKEQPKDIDKQDAEAVLDALERVEPTVQKDLARRRAGTRRAAKDW
jgi:tetratricopeptide (TPR) repeat protein